MISMTILSRTIKISRWLTPKEVVKLKGIMEKGNRTIKALTI
jgi:hypothetical protein